MCRLDHHIPPFCGVVDNLGRAKWGSMSAGKVFQNTENLLLGYVPLKYKSWGRRSSNTESVCQKIYLDSHEASLKTLGWSFNLKSKEAENLQETGFLPDIVLEKCQDSCWEFAPKNVVNMENGQRERELYIYIYIFRERADPFYKKTMWARQIATCRPIYTY